MRDEGDADEGGMGCVWKTWAVEYVDMGICLGHNSSL